MPTSETLQETQARFEAFLKADYEVSPDRFETEPRLSTDLPRYTDTMVEAFWGVWTAAVYRRTEA